jgi:serine/threonine protein kinase/tetratricopeptide (TPR) repeat protein
MRPGTIPSGGPGVASIVEAYESARAEGNPVNLERFLPARGDSLFFPALAELIRVEMEISWSEGRPKRLADYRGPFPELFENRPIFADVAFEEYRQRQIAGEKPSAAEYQRLFDVDVSDWPSANGSDEARHRQMVYTPGISQRLGLEFAVPTDFPAAGGKFAGFELLAELGRGAFGRVYLARQPDLANRLVALKISRDVYVESQALARLQHTNVMPIFSVHHAPPFHAVCMPYFPSVTLTDLCREAASSDTVPHSAQALLETVRNQASAPLPQSDETNSLQHHRTDTLWAPLSRRDFVAAIVWIGSRLADGMAHAHERGIVHRDLKPANVLLTDEGQPLLVDFNLAEDAASQSGERAFLGGTLPYMAPEQLRAFLDGKAHTDPRSDVYSLGLILFELLARKHPFPNRRGDWRTAAQAMLADRQGPPPKLRPIHASVTPAVEAIIRHCLEPDPARRYQSARALQEDLQRQFDHQPLKHLREPSLRERWRKFLSRNPGLLSSTRLGIVAVGLVILLLAGFVIRGERLASLQSRDEWRDFQRDVHSTEFVARESRMDIDHLAESSERVATLLDRYDARRNPEWMNARRVRRLSGDEQIHLRSEVGGLLYRLARNMTQKAVRTPENNALLLDALDLNRKAERSFPDSAAPRAIWLQRGAILDLLGRKDEAAQARAIGKSVPLRTTRDCLLELSLNPPPEETDKLLKLAERFNPGDADHWYRLGLIYRDNGKFERAEQCLSISLGLQPRQPWVLAARGEVRIERRDLVNAVADLDAALAALPEADAVQINCALAHELHGDYQDAIKDLTEVLDRSPERLELLWQRSRARMKSGDAAGAKADRDVLLSQKPHTLRAWVARAQAESDRQAALADLDEALKLDPQSMSALQNKAHILSEELNRPQEALKALDSLIEHHRSFVDAWAGRGVILARLNRRDEAIRDAREALRLDPRPIIVYQVAGIFALTSAKQPDDAKEALRLLARAFRDEPNLRNLVAGDPDLAAFRKREDFRKLMEASRVMLDGK